MRRFLFSFVLFALVLSMHAAGSECAVIGEPEHWIKELCLYKQRTDDVSVAETCIAEQRQLVFRSNCTARLHYKRALCELTISRGQRTGSIDACVEDRSFSRPANK